VYAHGEKWHWLDCHDITYYESRGLKCEVFEKTVRMMYESTLKRYEGTV